MTERNTMKTFQNRRNPILPLDVHIPDSEAHMMPDGKLYLYGSYDDREDTYCSEKYHPVSTPDLEHWTVHEESLNGKDIPWFNNLDAPNYPGIDWMHPTPFIMKLVEDMIKNGEITEEQTAQENDSEQPGREAAPAAVHRAHHDPPGRDDPRG